MSTDTLMPAVTVNSTRPRHPRARWLWLALAAALALLLVAGLIVQGLSSVPTLDLTIEGEPVISGWSIGDDLAALEPLHKVAVMGGLVVALLAMVVVVPLALAFAGLALAVVMLMAVGIPVLIGLAVGLLVLSPLLLIGWLLWKAVT